MVAAALPGAMAAPILAAAVGPEVVVLLAASGSLAAVLLVRRPVEVAAETVREAEPAAA
jgi:hypothetical protein